MASMNDIQRAAQKYSEARDSLAVIVGAMNAGIEEIKHLGTVVDAPACENGQLGQLPADVLHGRKGVLVEDAARKPALAARAVDGQDSGFRGLHAQVPGLVAGEGVE